MLKCRFGVLVQSHATVVSVLKPLFKESAQFVGLGKANPVRMLLKKNLLDLVVGYSCSSCHLCGNYNLDGADNTLLARKE